MNRRHLLFFLTLSLFVFSGCGRADQKGVLPQVSQSVEQFILREMEDKGLPAVSIAIVHGQNTWTAGYGFADAAGKVPATAGTVYRVGSVSKLFTDIGIMQLVEAGQLNLDVPIANYLPDFKPDNPYGKAITLRQLMSHRAGLVREPPLGHYFDPEEPDLSATVASLNGTRLVHAPESATKYSNAGIAVVGYVLEQLKGKPFADHLKTAVLEPFGMTSSSFKPEQGLKDRLADALMWGYDGRTFPAPTFELGMSPAGSMYSTVEDLATFMRALMGENPVIGAASLREMWTPQFAEPGSTSGFGLGFALSERSGKQVVGHGGAIYGFATELAMIPEEGIGVVVAVSRDLANSVAGRIADVALEAVLAAQNGTDWELPEASEPIDPELARSLDGFYEGDAGKLELRERNGRLQIWFGSVRGEIRQSGGQLITDDLLSYGKVLDASDPQQLVFDGKLYRRMSDAIPDDVPNHWKGLIGEYGWDHNVLFVLEKYGQLHALIEWGFLYPLREEAPGVFAFPDYGLYPGEKIVFETDETGHALRAIAAGIAFERRQVGTPSGETFKIKPMQPVALLRKSALAAEVPPQPDTMLPPELVELTDLEPDLRLDIRYASTNNFMDAVFYDEARAFLQKPAAEALVRVHRNLAPLGYGLLIHDAYRPWYVTKMFYDATPENQKIFVANPATGSIHNRGGAVDLTLFERSGGAPITTVGGYDEFSERSFPDYPGGTSRQRWYREVLRDAMEAEGFTVYPWEWWHFNYRDAGKYPVLNLRFDQIGR
ncbi:MAG: serine hydrolase [Saprospiraceae bacterium]|nr:serine hydrolase [Saprospiraceae bacterium]MDP4998070.1 serine hydrolase [Saprospiraceae bacterium]